MLGYLGSTYLGPRLSLSEVGILINRLPDAKCRFIQRRTYLPGKYHFLVKLASTSELLGDFQLEQDNRT